MKRRGRLVICCALVLGFIATLPAMPASAQIRLDPLLELLAPKPPPEAPPPAPQPGAPAPAPAPAPVGSLVQAPAFPAPRPAVTLQVPNIRRSAPKNTLKMIEILKPLVNGGMPMQRLLLQVSAPFPVAGEAKFVHDWGFPRATPVPHLHQGTDVFAAFGTPIVTSESGRVVAKGTGGAGGISVWVGGDSGMGYYYAHLQSWARGLQVGQRVEKGTIIGFIGDTGNAEGGAPHLHFELHPGGKGSPARDSKPFLDDALRQAEERAVGLLRVTQGAVNGAVLIPRVQITKKVDKLLAGAAAVQRPGDLMWFSVLEPTLGVIGLARQTAAASGGPTSQISPRQVQEEAKAEEVRNAVRLPEVKMVEFAGKPIFDSLLLSVTRPIDAEGANGSSYSQLVD